MNIPASFKKVASMATSRKTVVFLGIVAVIVILVIIFSGPSDKTKKHRDDQTSGDVVATVSMTPVVDGDYTYAFEDIRWDYTTTQDSTDDSVETSVGFFFNKFTRRDGASPVAFKRPFYVGLFQGDCADADEVAQHQGLDTLGTPVAFSICGEEKDQVTIGVFQKDATISIYSWDAKSEPKLARDIDITNIVATSSSQAIEKPVDFSDQGKTEEVVNRRRTIREADGI